MYDKTIRLKRVVISQLRDQSKTHQSSGPSSFCNASDGTVGILNSLLRRRNRYFSEEVEVG
jgi:hypothetical protein